MLCSSATLTSCSGDWCIQVETRLNILQQYIGGGKKNNQTNRKK